MRMITYIFPKDIMSFDKQSNTFLTVNISFTSTKTILYKRQNTWFLCKNYVFLVILEMIQIAIILTFNSLANTLQFFIFTTNSKSF